MSPLAKITYGILAAYLIGIAALCYSLTTAPVDTVDKPWQNHPSTQTPGGPRP